MKILEQLALVIASIAMLLAIMAAVTLIGRRNDWPAELQRKCVHVATGIYALTLPLLFSEPWPVLLLVGISVVVMLVIRLPRFAKSGLGLALHGVERKSYGELFLAISIGFIFFFSAGNPVLYVLPIAVITLADSAAAMIGTRYGRRLFKVEAGTKSLEGVTMFFLVTLIVSMVILLAMTDIGRVNVILLAVVIAAFGALVEADSWRGFDNLFVPVGIHLFLAAYLSAPPTQLFVVAAMFITALLIAMALAPVLNVSPHAARAYTALIFLIFTVTEIYNVVLPAVVILVELVARRVRRATGTYPDLDLIAAISGVALLWLFIGEGLHRNAINLSNLTFAGAALASVAAVAGGKPIVAALAAVCLFAMTLAIASLNHGPESWQGTLWPWAAASLAICLLVPLAWPAFLDRYRASRTFALSLSVPLALFLTKGFLT